MRGYAHPFKTLRKELLRRSNANNKVLPVNKRSFVYSHVTIVDFDKESIVLQEGEVSYESAKT